MKSKRKSLQDFRSYELPGDLNVVKGGSTSIPLDQQGTSEVGAIIIVDDINAISFIGIIDDIVA